MKRNLNWFKTKSPKHRGLISQLISTINYYETQKKNRKKGKKILCLNYHKKFKALRNK